MLPEAHLRGRRHRPAWPRSSAPGRTEALPSEHSQRGRGCRRLLIALLLPLLSFVAVPSLRAELPGPRHEIDALRFEHDGDWFVLAIPTQASWAHWTLANPARIVVDLADAVSALPEAPGLYEVALQRGPVQFLRTSQFTNTPLDRRVRITLELNEITPYEARRVGDEIHILVECKGVQGSPGVITSRGLEVGGKTLPAVSRPSAPAAEAVPTAAPPRSEERTTSRSPKGEAAGESSKGRTAPNGSEVPARSPSPGADEPSVGHAAPAGGEARASRTASEEPSRLADAAKHAFHHDYAADPAPMPRRPESGAAAAGDHGSGAAPESHAEVSTGVEGDHEDFSEPEAGENAPANDGSDPADGPVEDIVNMRTKLEELLGTANVAPIQETPNGEVLTGDELRQWMRDEEFPQESFEDWEDFAEDEELESPDSLRTRRASTLLRAAIQDWVDGDFAGAERRADRCVRHYGAYAGGEQAALLLREIYRTSGREVEAAALENVSELPDTSHFHLDFFDRLLAAYYQAGDRVRLLDRMESWGALYPSGDWYARYHYLLGREAWKASEFARAEEHLGRVPLGHPGGDAALLLRARMADEAGRIEDALALYGALAEGADGPYALRGRARAADLEFQRGALEAARDGYAAVLAADPPSDERAWALYQVGSCALLAGDRPAARQAYERLLEELPDAYWAPFARERLESMGWEGDVARKLEARANP